jgi:hypothetical protein
VVVREYSLVWKPLALALLLLGYPGLYHLVPPRHRVEEHWGADGVNGFGQGPTAAWGYAAAILAVLYSFRYLIRRGCSPASALAWYVMLLASLLPAVWLLVVFDWDNQAVSAVAC